MAIVDRRGPIDEGLRWMETAREHPLVRRLESITDLSTEERSALLQLPMTVKSVGADQEIVREGDKPSECCLVLEGAACRYKTGESGARQIMSFHIQGDIPDFQSLFLKTMDLSLGTLTPCRMAFIAHQSFQALFDRHPRLLGAFMRGALIDAAIFREWLMNVGRRRGEARHYFEQIRRQVAAGLDLLELCGLGISAGQASRTQPSRRAVVLAEVLWSGRLRAVRRREAGASDALPAGTG